MIIPWIIGVIVTLFILIAMISLLSSSNKLLRRSLKTGDARAKLQTQIRQRAALLSDWGNLLKTEYPEAAIPIAVPCENALQANTAVELEEANKQLTALEQSLLEATKNAGFVTTNPRLSTILTQLESVHQAIAAARAHYNETVKIYNEALARFPAKIVAKLFRYQPRAFLE